MLCKREAYLAASIHIFIRQMVKLLGWHTQH